MRTLDLDSLQIFASVAREGGVVHAAARLHRVPSNVTTRVKQLEERLGLSLFRRQGRRIVLTNEGHALLAHAERLLRLADDAERALRSGGVQGPLRLGSLESAAGVRLPQVLAAFHAVHPDVQLDLRTGTSTALLRQVERYEVEAAFVSEPFTAPTLASRPVFAETLVLITAAGAPPVRRASDLAGRSLVAFAQGCSYRRLLEDWLAEDGQRPERVLELASYHAIVACVAAGAGCAVVPESVLDLGGAGDSVRRHALPARWRRNRTHLVWQGEPSPALSALMQHLPALRSLRQ